MSSKSRICEEKPERRLNTPQNQAKIIPLLSDSGDGWRHSVCRYEVSFICVYVSSLYSVRTLGSQRRGSTLTSHHQFPWNALITYYIRGLHHKRQVEASQWRIQRWNVETMSEFHLAALVLTITTGTLQCKIHINTEVTWYPHISHLRGHNICFVVIHSHGGERSCGKRRHFPSLPPHTL